jgi:hypothetical protein
LAFGLFRRTPNLPLSARISAFQLKVKTYDGEDGDLQQGRRSFEQFLGGSIMTVLAVEGLKVRCLDNQERQCWFDTNLLERYRQTQSGPDGIVPSGMRQPQVSN